MYKHAVAHHTGIRLTRAMWRKYIYSNVQSLHRFGGSVSDLNAPAWLLQEIERFSPRRWLAYWNLNTGQPKAEALNRKLKRAPARLQKPSENLFTRSNCEVRNPQPRRPRKGAARKDRIRN
jgi:hypothetical protein